MRITFLKKMPKNKNKAECGSDKNFPILISYKNYIRHYFSAILNFRFFDGDKKKKEKSKSQRENEKSDNTFLPLFIRRSYFGMFYFPLSVNTKINKIKIISPNMLLF